MVGVGGFEPPASRSRTERSTKLSHTPTGVWILHHLAGAVELALDDHQAAETCAART